MRYNRRVKNLPGVWLDPKAHPLRALCAYVEW